ncbi:IS630 family transposase [Streptomyces sp. NPDC085596]|uniref:IS630 family transposase n=1 Tax=Streptomyces sp. NPDC085596 TaxID=3365731 RepID=UPI0037D187A1
MAWIVFEDEAGQSLTPPRARTWGRIGQTPVGRGPRFRAGVDGGHEANAEWLTVFQLPVYAPNLNPTEGIWSLVKRDIGNLAAADLSQITSAVKRRLKRIQYRPALADGCLAETGLIMDD